MKMLVKLAFRNIFRNKRRTILSGLAIGVGLSALIVFDAWIIGLKETMIRTATSSFTGQAQVHAVGYRKTYDVEKVIVDKDSVIKKLMEDPDVESFAPRVASYGMINSTYDVASVIVYGIDPKAENKVTKINEIVTDGRFLQADKPGKMLIGKKLAKNLQLKVGDKIVLTVAQAKTGSLSQDMFRVGGIFYSGTNEMDASIVYINIKKAQEMLHLGNGIHEIAFNFRDIKMAKGPKAKVLYEKLSLGGNEALGWDGLFKELSSILDLTDFSMLITAFVLFGVVSIGIVNTLFMSLYERMFEFGVIKAVGTRPLKIASIVVLEACFLCALSIVIGIVLGYVIVSILSVTGIDYRGLEFAGVGIKELIYPVLTPSQFVIYPIWLFLFTVGVSVYPAVYAAKLRPAKALRKSF